MQKNARANVRFNITEEITERKKCRAHPDSGLGEIRPHGYLLSGAHVRVPVPGERGLQFLELLRREVRPLSPLSLRVLVVLDVGVLAVVRDAADARVDAFGLYAGHAERVRSSCCAPNDEVRFKKKIIIKTFGVSKRSVRRRW